MADKNTTSTINLAAAEELPKAQSKFKEFVKKFMKRKTAVISLAFIVFIILMAIIGPYGVPYDPQAPDYTAMMQGPSAAHIWGTNEYGQDVFSRLMVGTRLSLTCALTATIKPYGQYVELGARGRPGVHMLQRAASEHGSEYKQIMEDAMKNA